MTTTLLAGSVALLLLAAACAHERLAWRYPDGSYDPERLAEDIDDCEEYTAIAEDDGSFVALGGAREWGGWGNFTFERCMNDRGWVLTSVPTERAGRG